MTRARLVVIAKYVLFAGLIALLLLALSKNWHAVKDQLGELPIWTLVVSELSVLGALVCTMFAWRALLAELGEQARVLDSMRIFFVGQLGKYLPGSVWPVVMQMELGNSIGLGRPAVATASLLGIGYGLGTGGGVTLLCAPALLDTTAWWQWLAVPLGGLVLGALCLPGPMNKVVTLGLRVTKRKGLTPAFTGGGLAVATAWMVASWLLYGLQVSLLAHDLGAHGVQTLVVATGGFAAAVVVGLVIIFAPAGAGARELLLVVLLKPVLDRDPATALTLVSRLVMSLGDVIVAVGAIATTRGARMAARRRNAVTMEEDRAAGGI